MAEEMSRNLEIGIIMTKQNKMEKELINPEGTEVIYQTMRYSQAVKVGNMIWVSGQVGVDESFNPAEGVEAQARLAFKNLQAVLKEAGADLSDVVELVTYHTDMAEMKSFARVKNDFISYNFPAWTAVGVKELVMPGLLVEIRATACICG
jgi:enamine deaminase RidA (YjgF/YER057c/UK114 family)